MDPLDGATESAAVGLVGTSADAVPGLGAVGAELGVEFRREDGADLVALDSSLVICADPDGLRSLADSGLRAPILVIEPARESAATATRPVVEWDPGRTSRLGVPRDEAAEAIRSLFRDGGITRHLRTLSVETESTATQVVFDVALVTDEPGAIATFAVRSNDEPVTEVRADGLAVATPAGSRGFARAAGGPVLAPETAAVTVVAVSPFAIDDAPWVGPPDGLELSIADDGPPAAVQCDGRVRDTIPAGSTLRVEWGPTLTIVTPDEDST